MSTDRENFKNGFTAIMAMAGSAIGLGNIWRFPYIVGENGGAAFILIYLLSTVLLSVPIFLAEGTIGHRAQAATFRAMEKLAPNTRWKWLGGLTIITSLIILSYYSVVGGWSIHYFKESLIHGFSVDGEGQFGSFISSPWAPLVCHTAFMGICAFVVSAGVKSGIERFNKYSMPLLFFLIIIIMCYSFSLPGAKAGIDYMIKPDFSKLTSSSITAAMGQSFFSLSLGVGCILTYASYLKKEQSLISTAYKTTGFDMTFALLAGFAVMPAVFAGGITPSAGPGLIFESLPFIFAKMGVVMPFTSRLIAVLFFVTIFFAAVSSAISMFEVGVSFLVEQHNINRKLATSILFIGCWALGTLCSLSFGPLDHITIMGRNIFGALDRITSDYLMAFGALLYTLFVGWKMKKSDVLQEMSPFYYNIIKWLAPTAIVVIFITNL